MTRLKTRCINRTSRREMPQCILTTPQADKPAARSAAAVESNAPSTLQSKSWHAAEPT